ncbi:uncharacterized protein EKO05_0001526 [Ascochyta rabiei]|uniref:uncharacterized protein n=1 Tax=Didymella rabiei TaxID=5454 RepID=UPI0019020DC1|nr:uncharacterized protein EKO05_0001526 [Ascochyta rabiei]UPX10890.1 hypothetical protein EKO05_0001526 [Ascochyta rabiei]
MQKTAASKPAATKRSSVPPLKQTTQSVATTSVSVTPSSSEHNSSTSPSPSEQAQPSNFHIISHIPAPVPASHLDVATESLSYQGKSTEAKSEVSSSLAVLRSGADAAATDQPLSRAKQPSKVLNIYICPYVDTGTCSHKSGPFHSFRGLVQHIGKFHANESIVSYEESTIEDDTRKIPRPKSCGDLYVTHQQANQHAKSSACTASVHTNLTCAWKPFNGCKKTSADAKGLANHANSHRKDVRSPCECSQDGCGLLHADLYKLAMHEERCTYRHVATRRTCYPPPAESGTPPALIIINRSSSHPPKSREAGPAKIEKDLPLFGKSILADYVTMSGLKIGPAALHSCSNCSTRELPAVAVDKSIFGDNLHLRLSHHRAFSFAQAITRDIQVANEAGVTPTLLSVGLDGWAGDERKLFPWL